MQHYTVITQEIICFYIKYFVKQFDVMSCHCLLFTNFFRSNYIYLLRVCLAYNNRKVLTKSKALNNLRFASAVFFFKKQSPQLSSVSQ